MGFLLRKRNTHGGVPVPSPQTRIAPVAAAYSYVNTALAIANQIVTTSVAIATSVARDAIRTIGSLPQSVTTAIAISTSTARTPTANLNTGTVNNTTGQYIMGTDGSLPLYFDRAAKWTSDSQWRANAIHNSLNTYSDPSKAGGVGGSNQLGSNKTLHGDGRFIDLIARVATPDAAFGPNFSEPCFEFLFPGANQYSSTPTGNLAAVMNDAVDVYNVFLLRRRAYCSTPEFTAVGDGDAAFNATQGAGFKDGPYATYYGGRAGLQSGNGQLSGGHPISNFDLVHITTGAGSGGLADISFGVNSGAERRDGFLYLDAVYIEQWIRASDSTTWCAATFYRRPDNSSTWQQISPRIVGQTISQYVRTFELHLTSMNYNQSRSTPLKWWITDLAAFDIDAYPDPARTFAQIAALTPEDPSNLVINSSSTSSINLKVTRGKYTGALRVMIDGVFLVGKDYTIQREEGEIQVTGGSSAALGTSTFAVGSLGLSAGSHTVKVYAVNKAGTAVSASGPSTTISV
jgi:hypothetical protein